MTSLNELCFKDTSGLLSLIRDREVSVHEVVRAHISQIERLNPLVNAVVTNLFDQALAQARIMDGKDQDRNLPLFGLPVLYKDLTNTKGVRTTLGSRIFESNVPNFDAIHVSRLKRAGAITLGKTNTPEFGAGSQTFNEVFGSTRNPYDLKKTCGGSSGGSAVSLACGFSPIADGSDFGGSLRNPASFCNVVGFRPSAGRVPVWPKSAAWFSINVTGPMARTVQDVALALSVMEGVDERDPLSVAKFQRVTPGDLQKSFKGIRVAWCSKMDGVPFDERVVTSVDSRKKIFETLGFEVEDAVPDLSDADEIFEVMRAWYYDLSLGDLLTLKGNMMKDTVKWNIEEGKKLTGSDLARVEKKRTQMFQELLKFFSKYEFLVMPTVQVLPFDIDQHFVTNINGINLKTYIEWMRSCSRISVTGLPSISIPGGFSEDGLPVGLQIVGGFRKDFSVLQVAHAFEQETNFWKTKPSIV